MPMLTYLPLLSLVWNPYESCISALGQFFTNSDRPLISRVDGETWLKNELWTQNCELENQKLFQKCVSENKTNGCIGINSFLGMTVSLQQHSVFSTKCRTKFKIEMNHMNCTPHFLEIIFGLFILSTVWLRIESGVDWIRVRC